MRRTPITHCVPSFSAQYYFFAYRKKITKYTANIQDQIADKILFSVALRLLIQSQGAQRAKCDYLHVQHTLISSRIPS
jgi:hypothetical protein